MVVKCGNCQIECVRYETNKDAMCPMCFQTGTMTEVPLEKQTDLQKSWNGLLGKSDGELMKFCKELAKDA